MLTEKSINDGLPILQLLISSFSAKQSALASLSSLSEAVSSLSPSSSQSLALSVLRSLDILAQSTSSSSLSLLSSPNILVATEFLHSPSSESFSLAITDDSGHSHLSFSIPLLSDFG